jgi:type I restriction enzyme, S subunit
MSTKAQQIREEDVATGDSELPEGWSLVRLAEICELNPLKPAANVLSPDTPVTFVPMPAVDAELGAITQPTIRPFSQVRKGYTAFAEGDVIMAKITPCMENGKAAVARGLQSGYGFGSTEFHVIRCSGAVLPEYIYHLIRQERFRKEAEDQMTGSVGQKRVPAEFLKNAKIPLPPLHEQERLTGVVGELVTQLRSTHGRLQRASTMLRLFRQAILVAACSGKLTEDWRALHPNCEVDSQRLLSEILTRRKSASNGHRRDTDPAEPDTSMLGTTPDEWPIVSMDALTSRITSGSRDWKQYYKNDGPGTFVMAQNVRPMNFDRSYRLAIAPPENDPDAIRSTIECHDILVTIVGANTGDVCRVSEHLERHYVCQSVALIRPVEGQTSRFLELYLNSHSHGQAQFQEWIYGEGRPHLSFNHLRTVAIALPPLEEQREIVRRVEALFNLADAIEKRVAAASLRAERLTQAILAKAFRGELVPTEAELELAGPDGRKYEPASVLLERIKAEKNEPAHRQSRTKVRHENAS